MSNKLTSAAQVRGALGILNWEYKDLAKPADVTVDTISKLCLEKHKPTDTTLSKLGLVFEREGIEFGADDSVKRVARTHEDFVGEERLKDFMAYMQRQIDHYGGEICVVAVNEKLFRAYRGEGFEGYKNKMKHHIETGWIPSFRIIAAQSEFKSSWAKYRLLPNQSTMPTAFYYFCGQLAMFVFDKETPYVHLIRSKILADAWKDNNFEFQWAAAQEP